MGLSGDLSLSNVAFLLFESSEIAKNQRREKYIKKYE